jgi:hypothetical protein
MNSGTLVALSALCLDIVALSAYFYALTRRLAAARAAAEAGRAEQPVPRAIVTEVEE